MEFAMVNNTLQNVSHSVGQFRGVLESVIPLHCVEEYLDKLNFFDRKIIMILP